MLNQKLNKSIAFDFVLLLLFFLLALTFQKLERWSYPGGQGGEETESEGTNQPAHLSVSHSMKRWL